MYDPLLSISIHNELFSFCFPPRSLIVVRRIPAACPLSTLSCSALLISFPSAFCDLRTTSRVLVCLRPPPDHMTTYHLVVPGLYLPIRTTGARAHVLFHPIHRLATVLILTQRSCKRLTTSEVCSGSICDRRPCLTIRSQWNVVLPPTLFHPLALTDIRVFSAAFAAPVSVTV